MPPTLHVPLLKISILCVALLAGCASTPAPVDKAQQLPVTINPSHPVWLTDARDAEVLKTPTFETTYGNRMASRTPEALIGPKPVAVLNHHFVEFFKESGTQPKTLPISVKRLDVGLAKGKAGAVGNSPGAEGYAGYLGAALGRMMAQAIADGGSPDYVIVETHLTVEGRLHDCGSLSPINNGDVAQAMSEALTYSARNCGRAIAAQ